jgi:hypothetical protein
MMRDFKKVAENRWIPTPEKTPIKVGLGCPRCDDHFLQLFKHGQSSPEAGRFLKKHMQCGPLDHLEQYPSGKTVCKGVAIVKLTS